MNRVEQTFALHCRAVGLPEAEHNYRFAKSVGRMYEVDFGFVAQRFGVEIQGGIFRPGGGAHSRPANILRDIEKAQCALKLGWTILPVTTDQVRSGAAVQMAKELLERRAKVT